MHAKAEEILAFWIDEIGPEGWYKGGAALDALCRDRFLDDWEKGRRGDYAQWTTTAPNALALLILLDQFPRNMFRGEARAFATDRQARAVAKAMIASGRQAELEPEEQHFVRLPLIHSETIADQEQGVRNCLLLGTPADNLLHARAHRHVIRRFGRFPFRNAALGRASTPEEEAWLAEGGYMATVEALA